MSVKLRLKRMGRKKIPVYRVIAIDSRRQRDGLELERLGIYNPLPEQPVFRIDEDRLFYWLEQGAEMSPTIHTLLKNHGLALKWHLKSQGKSEQEIEREFQKWQLLRESKEAAIQEQEKREAEETEKAAAKEEAQAEAKEETEPAEAAEPEGEEAVAESAGAEPAAEEEAETEVSDSTEEPVEQNVAEEEAEEEAEEGAEEEAEEGAEEETEEDAAEKDD